MNNDPLPSGWEMIFDKATGWPFFVDHNTRSTTWQDPRQAQKMGPGQYSSHGPGVREIPIIHENSQPGRTGSPGVGRGHNSPARDVPIMREGSNSPHHMQPRPQPPQQQSYGWASPAQPQMYPAQQPAPSAQMSFQSQRPAQPHFQYSSDIPQSPPQNPGVREIPILRQAGTPRSGSPAMGSSPKTTTMPQPVYQQPQPAAPSEPEPPNNQNLKPEAPEPRAPSPNAKMSVLELVHSILREAEDFQMQVNNFTGKKGEKTYLLLEENLTRLLIKLDNIDSEGREEIRNVRRQAVRTVQSSIDQLELKAFANEQPDPSR
ncbi:hypothetical protein CAPTEDRAFT_182552 [Capitella teleta]|uniref:WW domain-containing protein n=1 Tax=Capitella teleta TaxID=283909 RepID=R7US10_CAPTE|nr:hypothetical protein CAPTEDRAFT_182552 [Capitella teleta]|eukprot:ELU08985.1 hypothetical protein CAPTEDRAFT_182552 [Capitella teleta]